MVTIGGDGGPGSLRLPAYCPRCQSLFPSPISIEPVGRQALGSATVACPRCGTTSPIASGIFELANGFIELIGNERMPIAALEQFAEYLSSHDPNSVSEEDVAQAADEADPRLGKFVRNSYELNFPTIMLLLVLIAINKCSLNLNLDVNEAIEQVTESEASVTDHIHNLEQQQRTHDTKPAGDRPSPESDEE